jgi:hypothetical protein
MKGRELLVRNPLILANRRHRGGWGLTKGAASLPVLLGTAGALLGPVLGGLLARRRAGDIATRIALRASAIGAAAAGAVAVGAMSIGALAIGRLMVRSMRISRLTIDQLNVRQTEGLWLHAKTT